MINVAENSYFSTNRENKKKKNCLIPNEKSNIPGLPAVYRA
jgi:hypothetical protein